MKQINNYFLMGKNIYLRYFKESDIPEWRNWFNDPEVTRYMQKVYFPNTRESQKTFFDAMYNTENTIKISRRKP